MKAILSIVVFVVLPLLAIWAIAGIIRCIRNRRFVSLLISLAGVAGVIVFLLLMRSALSNGSYGMTPEGEFCGTAAVNQTIDTIYNAVTKYTPWIVASLIVAGTGGWVSLFRRKKAAESAADLSEPTSRNQETQEWSYVFAIPDQKK